LTSAFDSEVSSIELSTVVTWLWDAASTPALTPHGKAEKLCCAWSSSSLRSSCKEAFAARAALSSARMSKTTLALIWPFVTTMRLIPSSTIVAMSCWRSRAICSLVCAMSAASLSSSSRSTFMFGKARSSSSVSASGRARSRARSPLVSTITTEGKRLAM
jgi:hypothetical protein